MPTLDIKQRLLSLPDKPGVYMMLDKRHQIIYVGKAKNLKKRVSSYFQKQLDNKTLQLVSKVEAIQITLTQNEKEALLLENNLIKQHQPKYNLLLKDDKSYPYFYLSTQEVFPKLLVQRRQKGKKKPGTWFGPYTKVRALYQVLSQLQKLFGLRQCQNAFFKSRTRPCLQYEIQRCSAPCVGKVSQETYQQQVQACLQFFEGKNKTYLEELKQNMQVAAQKQAYELAATYRDHIQLIESLQTQSWIIRQQGDEDVLGLAYNSKQAVFCILSIREGSVVDTRYESIFLKQPIERQALLEAFVLDYYGEGGDSQQAGKGKQLVLPLDKTERSLLSQVLLAGDKEAPALRGADNKDRRVWLQWAEDNAKETLRQALALPKPTDSHFEALQQALGLVELPQKIVCLDISHTRGQETVGAIVAFNEKGRDRPAYRQYAIHDIAPGDDYAAIEVTLSRYYTELQSVGATLPDVLIIDGGKGQLNRAKKALEALQVNPGVLVAIAKGRARKAGEETLYLNDSQVILPLHAFEPAFHALQAMRDEAHRHAIGQHRRRRGKVQLQSALDGIKGLGPQRQKALLSQFPNLEAICQASSTDLLKIKGFSIDLVNRLKAALLPFS